MQQSKSYKLLIQTDKYVGDFERELVSYVTGILDDAQLKADNHAVAFQNAFWKDEFGIDNFSASDMYNGKSSCVSFSILDEDDNKDILIFDKDIIYLDADKIPNQYDLYTDYLKFICRDDDIEAYHLSFYTDGYSGDYLTNAPSEFDMDCVLIHLKQSIVNTKWEQILIQRIIKFFCDDDTLYQIAAKEYEWDGPLPSYVWEKRQLKAIALLDDDDHIVHEWAL